jgi:hypothetical protein
MNISDQPLLVFTAKQPPMSSTDHGGGKRRPFIAGPGHVELTRRELFAQDQQQQGCGWRGRDNFW